MYVYIYTDRQTESTEIMNHAASRVVNNIIICNMSIICKKSYNLDSERYMAEACVYLCRQCCFIDGFGEFGEYRP